MSAGYTVEGFARYCEHFSAAISGGKPMSSFEIKDASRSLKTMIEGASKEQFFESPLFASLVKSVFELTSDLPDTIRGPTVPRCEHRF